MKKSDNFADKHRLRNILGGISHFAIGITLAGYKERIIESKNQNKTIFLTTIATIFFILFFNHNYALSAKMIIVSHIIGIGLIVLHILLEKRKLTANLLTKILMILGVLSYGIYAWHGFLAANRLFISDFVLHTASSIMLAYITYKLVEEPALTLKKTHTINKQDIYK